MFFFFLRGIYFRLFLLEKKNHFQSSKRIIQILSQFNDCEIWQYIFISHTNLLNICFGILI